MDIEAQALMASVRLRLFGDEAPVSIGRFVVEEAVGRGGMGIVYRAHDPQLSRTVAVKVLRPMDRGAMDPDRASRLLREARAMARFRHPNVAVVYEVGNVDVGVYIAMEFIDGTTLRKWIRERAPSWRQIVTLFIAAGRGIAAAHEAGLVHRDFKPDNVMVETKGDGQVRRVCVLDFGLARPPISHALRETIEADLSADDESITEAGTVLGTPAYMAPEQKERGIATAASDVYSFCVALHEAAYGHRPDAAPKPEATKHRVPARLGRAIERGLRREPQRRWASMRQLVAELERIVAPPRRWRWVAGAVVSAGLGALVMAGTGGEPPPADPCPSSSAQAEAVLDTTRAERIATAVAGATPFARDAWPQIERTAAGKLVAWATAADGSCEATRVDGTQTEAAFVWRSHCFEAQLQQIDAVLELVEGADPGALEHASGALAEIDPARACSETRARRLPDELPTAEQLPGVREGRVALARASALIKTARYDEAIAVAGGAVADAEALSYAPLLAEAHLTHARARVHGGKSEDAEASYYAAIEAAETSRHDEVTARAWISLVRLQAITLGRLDEADRLVKVAQGAVARLGDAPVIAADLDTARASVLGMQGKPASAVTLYARALSTYETQLSAGHPKIADTRVSLGGALRDAGRPHDSLEPVGQAVAATRARVGDHHPELADQVVMLGSSLAATGDMEGAAARFGEAVDIYERALGSDHPRLAIALVNRGNAYSQLRQFDLALPDLRRANALDEKALGPRHPYRAQGMYSLAMAHRGLGNLDEAHALLEKALQILDAAWGSDHPDLSYLLTGLSEVEASRGDHREALRRLERVRELIAEGLGPRHPRIVHGLVVAANSHLALDEPEPALKLVREAVDIGRASKGDPLELAESEFVLARALQANGEDGREYAESARRTVAGAGPHAAPLLQRIDAWLGV